MTLPRYLAIAGRIGSGKDTLASRLADVYGVRPVAMADELKRRTREILHVSEEALWGPSETRYAPLDPLLLAVALDYWRMSGYWQDLLPDTDYATRGKVAHDVWRAIRQGSPPGGTPTVRWALQLLGTEFGRALDPYVWVRAWRAAADHLLAGGGYSRTEGCLRAPSDAPCGVVVTDLRFPNEAQSVLDAGGRVLLLDADKRIGPRTDSHASEDDRALRVYATVVDASGTAAETFTRACAALGLS